MTDLNYLQDKHDIDTKINCNLINQIERINNYLENKDDKYTLKLLEKQFLNTGFFRDWLSSYSYNKLQIINEECDGLFDTELETIIKLLLFFRHFNLINEDNNSFIKTIIDNIHLYIRFMCADTENNNIINNCSKYIINNKESCILNNIIKLSENKNTVQNKSVIENPKNPKLENTDTKNIVCNKISKNTINIDNNSKIIDSEKNIDSIKIENKNDNLKIQSQNKNIKNNTNSEDTKKRKDYKKNNRIDIINKTVNNISSYKIKNKDIYKQLYEFNRCNIKLFSDIYIKYKVEGILSDDEFNTLYTNFDKNKNRFLKICKIYYLISKENKLINSDLLFFPYSFNEISIKDNYLELFKDSIIKYIDSHKK